MRLIAHRGRKGLDPENSLAGLKGLAGDLKEGLAGIEIDVRVTADAVPVMLHDTALERVTNGYGLVEKTQFNDLQALRLIGSDEEPPPRLSDYLDRAAALLWPSGQQPGQAGAAVIYLDIKTHSPSEVSEIARLIRSLPYARGIVCLGKTRPMIEALVETGKGALRLGLLRCTRDTLAEHLDIAHQHKLEVLFVQHGLEAFRANMDIIPEIRAAKFEAGGSILNGPIALELARKAGCDLVLTDLPT